MEEKNRRRRTHKKSGSAPSAFMPADGMDGLPFHLLFGLVHMGIGSSPITPQNRSITSQLFDNSHTSEEPAFRDGRNGPDGIPCSLKIGSRF